MRDDEHTPVPNLRGGQSKTLEYLLGPGLPLLVLIGTLAFAAAQFARKDSVDVIRDEVWKLRLSQISIEKDTAQIRDNVNGLVGAVNEVKASQQTQLLNQAAQDRRSKH